MFNLLKEIQLKRIDSWINNKQSKVFNYLEEASGERNFYSGIISAGETSLLNLSFGEDVNLTILKSRTPYYWWRQKVLHLFPAQEDSDVEGQALETATIIRNSTNLQVVSSIDVESNSCRIELVYPVNLFDILSQNKFIEQMETTKEMIQQQIVPALNDLQEAQKNDQALLEEYNTDL